jgi:cytochrome c biogenesis protein ResB
MMIAKLIITPAKKVFSFFASLKVAIPLLVLTIAVTIIGTLFPDPDLFKSGWYLGLLALNGISLLFITILHVPLILKRKGRNALVGVVVTHLGILILIVGVIYGGFNGFRHKIKLLDGEITVIPGLPFVIQVDELLIEEYRQEDFPHMPLDELPKKRQQVRFTLLKNGKPWHSDIAEPGWPAVVDGITLLPIVNDTGWYFELITIDHMRKDREATIPVRPWELPLIKVGGRTLMAHARIDGEIQVVEIFALEDNKPTSLGFINQQQPLKIGNYSVSLGPMKRFMGIQVYNRPAECILISGSLLMLAGLVWHFYFRHRDRKEKGAGQ